MTQSIAPEMLAAAAEKQGLHSKYTDQAAQTAGKMGFKVKVPSLKDLVTKPGYRSCVAPTSSNQLTGPQRGGRHVARYYELPKTSFPRLFGNECIILARFIRYVKCYYITPFLSLPPYLFSSNKLIRILSKLHTVLLFVFWYCHKRGREVRLEKERLLTEEEAAALKQSDSTPSASTADHPTTDTSPPLTTTAPDGAPLEEVQAGMHHHLDDGDDAQKEESAPYAEGGSLAKELKREQEEAAAAKAKAREEEK